MDDKNMTFEDKIKALKKINNKLSSGNLDLHDNLKYFKNGKQLIHNATDELHKAKTEFAKIEKDDGTEAPFSRDKNGKDTQDTIDDNDTNSNNE